MAGCASEKASPEARADSVKLTGAWRVEDIDQGGVIDGAMVTLQFEEQDRIAGSTGCNRYTGAVDTAKNRFVVSKAGSTRRACVPAVAKQEQRFLAALNDATRYEIESETWLVIYDGSSKQRLKLIQMAPRPGPQNSKPDQSLAQTVTFRCENAGSIGIRFLGPETIEVSTEGRVAVLQRLRSASGAEYAGENMRFWNKGNEALFSMDGREYHCTKESP